MSNFVSRGFSGRRRTPDELAERLPPGQSAEPGFPEVDLKNEDAIRGIEELVHEEHALRESEGHFGSLRATARCPTKKESVSCG